VLTEPPQETRGSTPRPPEVPPGRGPRPTLNPRPSLTDPANPLDPHHSGNPNSIMSPFTHADARCAQRGRPYLRRAAGARRKGGAPKL